MIKKSSLLVFSLLLILTFTLTATELKQPEVVRVIDGDTIEVRLEVGTAKVRYIGIDIPETHGEVEHFGKEATEYNKALVREKTVWPEIWEEVTYEAIRGAIEDSGVNSEEVTGLAISSNKWSLRWLRCSCGREPGTCPPMSDLDGQAGN